eukprot:CAMPEP_0201488526 /NCGR_PEP_ID=MMETSP0151_2-20130828/18750_1 /ASSEMBLY_ACC=CAM_ASM_000257 /TAXON_ID=200890 /ORGANISM="Paramoeba atlantica, Strain 621/1 / CCAP 1560/9" /LENGTH=217 /DNA_ID=CAMNT_0047873839 /DNA_START=58 /DNA_END=711 /DNA_ORIENTATION=-
MLLSFCLFFLSFSSFARSLTLQVEPKTSECFFEEAKNDGDTLSVYFEVTRGGLLDIVFIASFEGVELENQKYFSEETEGKFVHVSPRPGTYKICFDNQMSRWTAKVVDFDMFIGETHTIRKQKTETSAQVKMSEMLLSEDLKKLEREAENIEVTLEKTKRTQRHLLNREKLHLEVSNNSNSRAITMALLEAAVLISISVTQIFLVHHMFKRRISIPI